MPMLNITDSMSICVISCIFGGKFKAVYSAVKNYDAYFFTNNTEIEGTVVNAGWKYIFIDFPLSDDEAISSFQSKYIKFLQFLKDEIFKFFWNYGKILYVDHKRELKDDHVEELLSKMDNKFILVRENMGKSTNIWEEVVEAMLQEKYLRFMPQTIAYIKEKLAEGYSEHTIVVLTGIIVYSHLEDVTMEFVDKVYNDLKMIGTSECQIVWSLLGQKYTDIIKIIEWNALKIKWKEPKNEKISSKNNNYDTVQFMDDMGFLWKELRNRKGHIKQLNENIIQLEVELKENAMYLEQLLEKERFLRGEVQSKEGHIEQLINNISYLSRELQNKTSPNVVGND